jgi:tetratricopeptide (TPR) repeat protein
MDIAQTLAIASYCHTAGHLTVASEHYGRILEVEPDHAEVLHRLGLIAQQQGHRQLAIDFLNRAVAGNGASADHWYNLGVVHSWAGNNDEAASAFEEALRLQPEHAEACNNLAIVLQLRGELQRSIEYFQLALQYRPAFPEAFSNLGNALNGQGKWEQAIVACRQALVLKPDYAEALNNLGIAYQQQEDLAQAIACYRQALDLQPTNADASNNLATALKEQGMLAESVAQYRETLRLKPCHALACYSLSQFVAEGWYDFAADELAQVKAQLADRRVAVLERSLHAFTLGAVYERQDSFDQAFEYYRQANDLRKQFLAQRKMAFDAERNRLMVDRIMATFNRAFFQRVQEWGTDTEVPVFVVGMPRTGSTLVEQILSSHPRVHGAGELGEVHYLTDGRPSGDAGCDLGGIALPLSDRATAQKMAGAYLKTLNGVGAGASRVINKTLGNFYCLGLIATLFPRARIIHCTRHPLDVGVSCYCQNFNNLDFCWSFEDIGAYYCQYQRLMAHWRDVLPVPIHEVRYEQLIQQQEAVTHRLVAFCGLDWDERCLTFFKTNRGVRTASTLQVRKPLTAHSIGRWQRFRAHVDPLIKALAPVMERARLQRPENSVSTSFDDSVQLADVDGLTLS